MSFFCNRTTYVMQSHDICRMIERYMSCDCMTIVMVAMKRLSCTKKYKFLHYVIYIPSTALAFILLLYLNFWQSYEKYWYMQKKAE